MDLREKLERTLRSQVRSADAVTPVPIEKAVPGEIVNTEFGCCYGVDAVFPEDYCLGSYALHCALGLDREGVCVAGKDATLESFDPNSCIYLDAETTGLAGGSGTYPFLVGVGFFSEEKFVVRQLFMRDYDEEAAVLSALSGLLENRKFLVTYNGRSFDVPLIQSRMIINRMPQILGDVYNLDLLHAARRVWGRTLSDCRLKTLEDRILGFSRGDDIPGEEIPERYFDYVRTGDASGLRIVFDHNRNDILMLPVLLGCICEVIRNVDYQGLKPLDLYAIGRVYDSMKKRSDTLPFYRRALKGLRGNDRVVVACHLGMVYKRLGKWDDAVTTWRSLLGKGVYQPYEELAKYYEHVSRDFSRARTVVEDALQVFRGERYQQSLKHRLSRIERKLSSGGGVDN